MGKSEAASVPWEDIDAAIRTNPQRHNSINGGGKASASIASLPTETQLTWLTGSWSEEPSAVIDDAITFGLWVRDPLFRTAVPAVRKAMEMEEAGALLHSIEAEWKIHNGRGRGWVRKHLEEDLRDRAAGKEPAPNTWDAVRTVKRAAQLVDYIATVRGHRFGLWWPELKTYTLIPMTGGKGDVIQLNCSSGHPLLSHEGATQTSPLSWAALKTECSWTAPACAPTVGATTVAQIQERLLELLKHIPPADRQISGGNRQTLWARLQREQMVQDLSGLTSSVVDPLDLPPAALS